MVSTNTEITASAASGLKPKIQLVGAKNFVRHNPKSDRFGIHRFHHVEFWASDATNTYKRFQIGLGMALVAKSDQSTGNCRYASYVLKSSDLVITCTAPYSRHIAATADNSTCVPAPHYSLETAYAFINSHGLAVRALGVSVDDAEAAFRISVDNGAVPVLPPFRSMDAASGEEQVIAEVKMYGDVVLRYVSGGFKGPYLANYTPVVSDRPTPSYGLLRIDHAVGNVPRLVEVLEYICGFTGFHEFAEFVAEDVGTLDSGLNSMVLANNSERILMPINEPTFGTPRKSQIQTYLEQNEGPGLQHIAINTEDIFFTLREMQARSVVGGLEFMPRPSDLYYKRLPERIGDSLTPEQYKEVEQLGLLVDKDDKGVLLQIFTKPLGDRPTVFLEIIQRVGCMQPAAGIQGPSASASSDADPSASCSAPAVATAGTVTASISSACGCATQAAATATAATGAAAAEGEAPVMEQAAGCGGFGKGNFSELFKRIEEYERTLTV